LFRDSEVKLQEQLQMAEALTEHFNFFTSLVDIAPINLEDLRKSLQSDTERKVAIWVNLARVEMLNVFGRTEEMHAAMDQFSRLFGPESGAVEA